MKNITETNILSFISDYFLSIGVEEKVAKNYFNSERFDRALLINLPTVCVVSQNKPKSSKSGETHIHITGQARSFFYPLEIINSMIESSRDSKIDVDISLANLKDLGEDIREERCKSISTVNSFTYSRISCRKKQPNQVQVGKMKQDDPYFIKLRKGLYTKDLLIFLGYRGNDKLYAIGISSNYYSTSFLAPTRLYPQLFSYTPTVQVGRVMETLKERYNDGIPKQDMDLIDDSIYQKYVIETEPSETYYAPVPKSGKTTSRVEQTKRNAHIGKEALKDGEYKCELNSEHPTFITKNGTPYVEAHHLIPMGKQDDFENSLDVKANIIPLCSFCHDRIHYGTNEDINNILEKLYEGRKELLKLSGIEIELDKLKQYYDE